MKIKSSDVSLYENQFKLLKNLDIKFRMWMNQKTFALNSEKLKKTLKLAKKWLKIGFNLIFDFFSFSA